jgi:CDP-diacylglycerol--serine O-phosphatidyltransferase
VARLTKTQSDFGMELDSLADVMSFGVAPSLLLYKWALEPLGFIGLFLSFCFAACGALRLARFNVLARRSPHGGSGRFFVGLPIPLASGMICSMVIAHHVARGVLPGDEARGPIAGVVAALALLMVSTVRYRTFKDVRLSRRSALVFMLVVATGFVLGTRFHPAFVLVAYCFAYLVFGLLESAFMVRNHLVARKLRQGTDAAVAALEEEDEEPVDE